MHKLKLLAKHSSTLMMRGLQRRWNGGKRSVKQSVHYDWSQSYVSMQCTTGVRIIKGDYLMLCVVSKCWALTQEIMTKYFWHTTILLVTGWSGANLGHGGEARGQVCHLSLGTLRHFLWWCQKLQTSSLWTLLQVKSLKLNMRFKIKNFWTFLALIWRKPSESMLTRLCPNFKEVWMLQL